ncbi:hypothetical protein [Brevundimonas sp.]|uniref:hypothetical protein n=1 Tax=Brevundimonas sp. TaxID=1871086 RepID=UPI002D464127|nr:hypothetical protein [Brevundimonas sp.]HYC66576.1 hypothetical protein [Brevundimonas sp.]
MTTPDPKTLALILVDYHSGATVRAEEDAWWADRTLTVAQSCFRAGRSLTPGERLHGHQCRPGHDRCRAFGERLQEDADQLGSYSAFEPLFARVNALTKDVRKAGELMAYDAADRIALRLGIPVERIHLHAGTAQGARALGLPQGRGRKWIEVRDLPKGLHALSVRDAENVLCIYADQFLSSPDGFRPLADPRRSACTRPPRRRSRC